MADKRHSIKFTVLIQSQYQPVEDVQVAVAPRRLIIFSSMSARTETDAVCSGGPVDSFLSSFLLSESWR